MCHMGLCPTKINKSKERRSYEYSFPNSVNRMIHWNWRRRKPCPEWNKCNHAMNSRFYWNCVCHCNRYVLMTHVACWWTRSEKTCQNQIDLGLNCRSYAFCCSIIIPIASKYYGKSSTSINWSIRKYNCKPITHNSLHYFGNSQPFHKSLRL